MLIAFLIVLGVLLTPVVVIFICNCVQGWRESQPPQLTPEQRRALWYDIVWGRKPQPKPKRRFRVVWPPKE